MTMTMSMNRLTAWIGAALLLGAAACGGKQKTESGVDIKKPPQISGDSQKALENREISKDAEKDYKAAIAFYQQQAQGGWSSDGCKAASGKFDDVARTHSNLVEARYMAGLSLQHCGMYKEAQKQYEAALQLFKAHAPSLSNLGEIYWHEGEQKLAKQYWESSVKADPKITAARNNLAWLMIEEMRQVGHKNPRWDTLEKDAKMHLSSVLAVDNENVRAYVLYGLLYMEGWQKNKNRLDLAKLLLDKGKERDAKSAALYNAYGLYYLHRDNVGTALSNFEQAVQIDPKFAEARMNVGNITLGFRKYDTAREHFTSVLQMQPQNYEAQIGLGVALRGLNQLEGAEEAYNKAMKLDSKRAEAYFNLGVLYKDFRANQAADLKQSVQLYNKAKGYFEEYMRKPDVDSGRKKEAQDNIADINKITKQIQEVIQVMEEEAKAQKS